MDKDGQNKKKKPERLSTRLRKRMALEALEASLGVISSATKHAKIPRSLFYQWLEKDAKFAEKVEEISEMSVDFSESALLKRIRAEDTTAIIFHLKTKGKNRGYGQEINLSGNMFDSLFKEFKDKDDDELLDMLKNVTGGK